MRRIALFCLLAIVLSACTEKPSWQTKPLSEKGETVYTVRGVIVSRDAVSNTIMLKHEKIEGFMEAMTMDFTVRGVSVETLTDGATIDAKLHVLPGRYWLTDIAAAK